MSSAYPYRFTDETLTVAAKKTNRFARWQYTLLILSFCIGLSGCASFTAWKPADKQDLPIQLGRIQSVKKNDVLVEVSVPTDDKASHFFGVPLAKHDIQPIWMQIVNNSDIDYWLMPFAVDPEYYPADEAALITGEELDKSDREASRKLFLEYSLPFFLKAHSMHSGYIYASHKRGGRFIDVRLAGHRHALRMRFAVLLPTESFDYEKSSLREMYRKRNELPDMSVDQVREKLRSLPCCVTNASSSRQGDPLNLVLIGSGEDLIASLTASGWDLTEAISIDSIRRMIGAAIKEQAFLTAPISSLYLFGRKQDLALQRGRSTIHQRNHLRLWLAPFRCEGLPVWVGQVSRDIGIKLTSKSPTLTTHIIDPLVDEAREYLFHSLLYHETVGRFAFVKGVGEVKIDNPNYNLTGDPYITDGMRVVIWLSQDPVPPHFALDLGWNDSADPALEGKGQSYMIPSLNFP